MTARRTPANHPPTHFLLATPKRCSACQRTVFDVDQQGKCPGCQRRAA